MGSPGKTGRPSCGRTRVAGQNPVEIERQSVSVAEARDLILGSLPAPTHEMVGLREACGRILAEEVRASAQIPPADNSAMDGFAVRAEDTARAPATLRVVEDLPAGRRARHKLGPGEAARIMTGAAIPEGADAVVMIERTEPGRADPDAEVIVLESATPGQNVRRAGADVRPGTPVANSGSEVSPALVGMLAAIGRTALRVVTRPRVAVIATGDELVEPDRLEADGRIVSSNSWALQAAIAELGAEPVYLGISVDEPDRIEAAFRAALRCDAVVSTGGVSVGDRDWIKQVLADLGGRMSLWRVNMKPGAPLAFARIDGRPVFGLPGNPVSTLVTFEQFVRPALLRMRGHSRIFRPVVRAVLAEDYDKPAGRMHFARVRLEQRADDLYAFATGDQSSGVLLSMVRAEGLAIVGADATHIPAGTSVPVQRIRSNDLRDQPGF